MKTTTNYGLKKPEASDFYNVEDFNYNADKVDEELKVLVSAFNKTNQEFYKVDLNTINYKTSGYCNECTNKPNNASNGYIEVIPISNARNVYLLQKYNPFNSNEFYIRQLLGNDGWTEWENPFSKYLPLSGGMLNGNIIPDVDQKRYLGFPSSAWLAVYANNIMLAKNNINYGHLQVADGTKDNVGAGILVLGNQTPSGNDGNAYGMIRLYNKDSGYTEITPKATKSVVLNFPTENGTLLCTGDKPTGTYTGNDNATERRINIGGSGKLLYVYNTTNLTSAIIGYGGGIAWDYNGNAVRVIPRTQAKFINGELILASTDNAINKVVTYSYEVI